ncbi:ATP-binding protein [Actinomadura bangladeshensis]|uniref:Histidine kinase/HSP90-like ATPase domain-containing protein n=1 Tax=Actinomadura bangladeshensis TaxID=453573 RepID=A0A4R4N7X7_9ACTN|nr:ATP-binding protein [Actinomadura bangladeshensis]TDC03017.1 hypothetical protein E1284_38865 [Actinomadura bangladeshensis]
MHVRFGPGATGKGPADGGHLASGLPVRQHVGTGHIVVQVLADKRDELVRIEVWDEGAGQPIVQGEDDYAEGGRGLLLMSELVHDWGVRPLNEEGKVVWARCAR